MRNINASGSLVVFSQVLVKMTLESTISAAAVQITSELPLPNPPVTAGFDGSDAVINGKGQFASRELPIIEPSDSENKEELESRIVKVIEDFRCERESSRVSASSTVKCRFRLAALCACCACPQ